MKRILFATLFTLIATTCSFAQTQPPAPQFTIGTLTHVKPGMMAEYQEFLKNETLPAFKKAGDKGWATYLAGTFGRFNTIITLRTINSLKEFDETNFLVKALGDDGVRAWSQKRARMIEGVETILLQGVPELFLPRPNPNDPPKIGIITITNVAPGRTAEYESLMKTEVMPLLKKTGNKGYAIGRVLFGGDTNEYRSMSYADSFEDVEKMGVAMQAAGFAKVVSKFTGIVLRSERLIGRFQPDLSIRPEPQKTATK
jgi:hypothetical protein